MDKTYHIYQTIWYTKILEGNLDVPLDHKMQRGTLYSIFQWKKVSYGPENTVIFSMNFSKYIQQQHKWKSSESQWSSFQFQSPAQSKSLTLIPLRWQSGMYSISWKYNACPQIPASNFTASIFMNLLHYFINNFPNWKMHLVSML
jgi:hypothetical protein